MRSVLVEKRDIYFVEAQLLEFQGGFEVISATDEDVVVVGAKPSAGQKVQNYEFIERRETKRTKARRVHGWKDGTRDTWKATEMGGERGTRKGVNGGFRRD